MTGNEPKQPIRLPTPDPALHRLEKLVGTWKITGRSLNSQKDDLSGQVIIEWLPGKFFLQQRGEIVFQDFQAQSLEIIGYDPSTKTFSSYVYSSMEGVPSRYYWDVQGNVATHWTKGSKYTGTFNEDGSILSGSWQAEDGEKPSPANTYDATMTRIDHT